MQTSLVCFHKFDLRGRLTDDRGSIHKDYQQVGAKINKGDELGLFQFGGSSIIVAFENGRIEFDQDLRDMSNKKVQTAVEVGMSLGRAVQKG